MAFCNAYEFWRDLCITFGENARDVAISYLDTISAQSRRQGFDDPQELAFCKDLYSLLQNS